jgi:fumarate reductase (CoM/CoB) subunit A
MWDKVAIIRNQTGLTRALGLIQELKTKMKDLTVPDGKGFNNYLLDALELENMLQVAELVTHSAIIRKESRGSHYREDYPKTLKNWNRSIVMNKDAPVRFIER